MSRIDALLADLQSEGTVDSQGGFTLDRDKAREKMRQFQLADPREYLLQLIRTAHCQGATRIDIEVDADDMHLRFDGAVFTQRDFEELYDALFGRADDPAVAGRRHLALGLNAALGLDPRRITVHSGAAWLTVVPDGDDDFGALDPPIEGTWLHARDRMRFSNVFRFFQGLGGSLPEAKLVAERCGFSTTDITINGKPLLDGRARIQSRTAAFHSSERDECWAYGGPTRPGRAGELHIIAGGVRVTTVALPGMVGFVGAAGSRHIRTDVSQADVIRDHRFERVMDCARAVQIGALEALMDAGEADAFLDPVHFVDRWQFLQDDCGKAFAEAVRARVSALTLAGETVRLVDVDTAQPVPVVTFDFAQRRAALGPLPAEFATLPIVVDASPFEAALAEVRVDRTPDLLRWIERSVAEQAFRRRRVDTLQLHGNFGVRTLISADGWRGQAGIAQADTGHARMTWIIDDCALSSQRVDLKVPGLHVMLRGPLTPAADYQAPEHDAAFDTATLLIAEAVQRLMGMLPPGAWGRRAALRWLTVALDGHPGGLLVQRLRGEHKAGTTVWLQALPKSDDPLARMPIFPTMQDGYRSLAELAAQVADGQPIDFVDPVVRGPAVTPPILSAADPTVALLSAIFGKSHVRSGSKRLAQARKQADFEGMRPRALDLSFETAEVVSEVRFDGGVVGLRRRAITTSVPGWFQARVQPFSRGRPLRVVTLGIPLPGVIGAVDVGDRALNAQFDGTADPQKMWMLKTLVPHLDDLFEGNQRIGSARRFMRALLDLWVPTMAHHEAWNRWDDPEAYRAALRVWWHAGDASKTLATWSATEVPRTAPPDHLREAILAPLFAASGSLAERFQAGYPWLSAMRVFRDFEGPDASINSVMAGIESAGIVLHASRASVFPPSFGGVALKTEHAQLERLARLVGAEAIARATTWKSENALATAVSKARADPGQLPEGTRGIVPIEDGEIGLLTPFDPDAPNAIEVVLAGKVVAVLNPQTKVPIVGRVAPSGDARMVLMRGELGVDDLTRVRVLDQAKRAVDRAIRAALAEAPDPERDTLLAGVLGARALGVSQRAMMRNDSVARALADAPIFVRLAGPPVSAKALINHRRRRDPLWLSWETDVPAPPTQSHWVLVVDAVRDTALKNLFTTSIRDYSESLAERAAAAELAERPPVTWDLPDATHVVEVTDGPVRALVGWGATTGRMVVLRKGRLLGEATLALGVRGIEAMVDDAALAPTSAWRSDPRVRRLRRLVASALPQLGPLLAHTHPDAMRTLIWEMLRFAWPSREWVALYEYLHLRCLPDQAQQQYREALQAAAQGTRYMLDNILAPWGGACPSTAAKLMKTYGRPTSSGGDRVLRAALGGEWPLVGDPTTDPLARLATQLGALGQAPWIPRSDGGWLSMAEVAHAPASQRGSTGEAVDAELLDAILEASVRIRAAEKKRQADDLQHRQIEAQRAKDAAQYQAKIEQHRANAAQRNAEVERRRQAIEAQRLIDAAARKVTAANAVKTPPPAALPPIASAPPLEPAAPKRTPSESLIDSVITRLTAVQADEPDLLADVNLSRLSARSDGPLAWASDRVFAINTTHPTARAAMAGDSVAELMVVIAAYGALNLWLADITDTHELQVVQHLLDLADHASIGEAPAT